MSYQLRWSRIRGLVAMACALAPATCNVAATPTPLQPTIVRPTVESSAMPLSS